MARSTHMARVDSSGRLRCRRRVAKRRDANGYSELGSQAVATPWSAGGALRVVAHQAAHMVSHHPLQSTTNPEGAHRQAVAAVEKAVRCSRSAQA